MAVDLPDVGGDKDAWGTILNTALTSLDADRAAAHDDISNLQTALATAQANITTLQSGAAKVPTGSGRPSAATAGVGALWNDAGQLSIVVSIGGTLYWTPFPGSHVATLRQTVAQSIPTAAVTPVVWGAADYDRLGGYNAAVSTTRYTAPIAGWYEFNGAVLYANSTVGQRAAYLLKNGATSAQTVTGTGNFLLATAGNLITLRPSPVLLAAGDYINLATFQSTAGALATDVSQAVYATTLTVKYLGSA